MALSRLVCQGFFESVGLSPKDGVIECSVFVVLLRVHSQINFITRIINSMRLLQILLMIKMFLVSHTYKINYFIIQIKGN